MLRTPALRLAAYAKMMALRLERVSNISLSSVPVVSSDSDFAGISALDHALLAPGESRIELPMMPAAMSKMDVNERIPIMIRRLCHVHWVR